MSRHGSCVCGAGRCTSWAAAAVCGLALVGAGCHGTRENWVLRKVQVKLPAMEGGEDRPGGPAEWLEAQGGGEGTLLVHCHSGDHLAVHGDAWSRDAWSRTFVVVLDGPPMIGKVAVTPANGRLIEAGTCLPPRRPYTGLKGELWIAAVEDHGRVIADFRVETVVSHGDEPVRVVDGRYWFMPPAGRTTLGAVRYLDSPAE